MQLVDLYVPQYPGGPGDWVQSHLIHQIQRVNLEVGCGRGKASGGAVIDLQHGQGRTRPEDAEQGIGPWAGRRQFEEVRRIG